MKQKSHKLLSLLLTFALMLSMAPTALAAGTDHTHAYGSWTTTKQPTFTEQGMQKRACTVCGVEQTEQIQALGHNYGDPIVTVAATCLQKGTKISTCSRCGDSKSEDVPPLGHSYTYTDDKNGTTHTATCNRSGCTAGTSGHSITEAHDFGTNSAKCSKCGAANPNIKETITLDRSAATISVSGTVQLRATVSPAGTAVTWSSSNASVASVSNGLVKGLSAGTATITASTPSGVTATCVVTVTAASNVLIPDTSSVNISVGEWASVYASTTQAGTYRVRWSVPSSSGALVSDSRYGNKDYSATTYISSTTRASVYVYGSAACDTTLTATLIDDRGNQIGTPAYIPVHISRASSILSAYPSTSITTSSNGWSSSSIYVTAPTSTCDRDNGCLVEWTTTGNVQVATAANTSYLGSSARTYMEGQTSGGVYVYATGSGTLTATLHSSSSSSSATVDSITIYVNTSSRGFTLSKSPSSSTVSLGYYGGDYYWDDYYWNDYYYDRYYYGYRDFSVTPYLNGTSIYSNSNYDIYYTWTLNGTTVQRQSNSSSASGYRLSASNSALYRNSRNNTLTCSVIVYPRGTTSSSLYSSSASWTVYTDYYYDSATVSATVFDTNSGYSFDQRDDKGNASIISQMSDKLGSRESIDYVRFSSVTDTYGNLSASTSRDYYYSSTRGSYDLRDVTFTPARVGRTGTASFGCTIYGTYGTVYSCTIRITVTNGTTSSGDIKYTARAGASVNFSASDFRSWWRDSYSRGDLDYVRFSTPSNGSLYIDYDRSNSKTVGSTNCYYSPSSSQTGINDLTFVPSSSSTRSASVRFTAYGTTSSSSSSTTSMSGTVTITYSGADVATITYTTTGTKSVNLSASDFTGRYRDVMGASAPSNTTIRFRSVPSSGTLAIGSTSLTSSNISSYNFSTSSSGSNRISDVKYTPKSNSSYTETVNYDCYTGSTLRFSGTITFKNTAENTVTTNVAVSYSSTGGNVAFNAADFIVGKGSAMAGSNYVVFGAPSSGSLYVGSTPLASGTKVSYVAASGMQLLGSVSYHPAAGFNGTATVPFTAYNANGTQAASGTVSIRVTQQTNSNTNNRTSFADVRSTDWFYNDVTTLAQANIVNGRNDGLFHPADAVNYGEALKLILLAAGYQQQTEGTGAAWAQNYLNLAVAQGLLPGSASNYTLSAPMNRTTIAVVAAKALKLTPVTNEASPYADAVDAEGYVLALTKAGIVQGDASSGKQMWNGSDNLTRAQISRIVYNVYKYRNVAPGGTGSTGGTVDTSKPGWLN